ncbi:MAG: COG1470 family protein [Chloroflexota bacterium]
MAGEVELRVEPEVLEVEAGGEVEGTAKVVNRGQVVDQYALTVEGLEAGWYEIRPSSVSLFPRDEAQVKLVIRLPMTTEVRAGEHWFKLVAVSQDNAERRAEVGLKVEVRAFGGIRMEVAPGRIEGRSGRYRVVLRNGGNAEAKLVLRGIDPEEGLGYKFDGRRVGEEVEVVVPAGGEREIGVEVKPKRGGLSGQVREYSFRIEARPPGIEGEVAEPIVGMAELGYKPPLPVLPFGKMPVWAQRGLMAVVPLLIIGLLAAALLNRPQEQAQPTPTSPPSATAVVGAPTEAAGAATEVAGQEPTPVPPPVIAEFSFTTVDAGDRRVLGVQWKVENADEVLLDGKRVDPEGKQPVTPVENRELSLLAKNAGGEVSKSLGLVLIRPPEIRSLKAEPQEVRAGEATMVRYEIWGADEAVLDGEPVPLRTGEMKLVPTETKVHVLAARNAVGETVREIEIKVLPKD